MGGGGGTYPRECCGWVWSQYATRMSGEVGSSVCGVGGGGVAGVGVGGKEGHNEGVVVCCELCELCVVCCTL
jgi:hypothetical protein